jgi:Nickel responsive protein SCO4226-like
VSPATFLVERYLPRLDAAQLDALVERLRGATAQLQAEGRQVEWIRSLAVIDDEACLCIFRALAREDVAEANARAEAGYERIVEALVAEPGQTSCSGAPHQTAL